MTSPHRRFRWPTLRQWFWISLALSVASLAALGLTWMSREPDPVLPTTPAARGHRVALPRPAAPPPRPLTECDRVIQVVNDLGRVLSGALQHASDGTALREAATRVERSIKVLEALRLRDPHLAELARNYAALLARFGLTFDEVVVAVEARDDRRILRATNALHALVTNESPRIRLINDYCRNR
jgi:hypothetical protein